MDATTAQQLLQPSPSLLAIGADTLLGESTAGSSPHSLAAFALSNQNCRRLYEQLAQCTVRDAPDRLVQIEQLRTALADATQQDVRQRERLTVSLAALETHVAQLRAKANAVKCHLAAQLETSCALLAACMAELVGERLVQWLIEQRRVSHGPRAVVKRHYAKLDELDELFEACGAEIARLVQLVDALLQLVGADFGPEWTTQLGTLRSQLLEQSRQFIWQSLVVGVQPPAVLVKCRGSDSHRGTKFPCKTEIRLLGGTALGVRSGQCSTVRVLLITEETARRVQTDPCAIATTDDTFQLIYNEARFEVEDPESDPSSPSLSPSFVSTSASGGRRRPPVCRAAFDRIRLVEKPSGAVSKRAASEEMDSEDGTSSVFATSGGKSRATRRSKVAQLRYYLAYQIELTAIGGGGRCGSTTHQPLDVRGYKLSLPLAALVHASSEADAALFWNRAFAVGTGILSAVPDSVAWSEAVAALNLKFAALMQEPHEAKDLTIELEEPRALSASNLEHLAQRLGVDQNDGGQLHRQAFFVRPVAHREGKDGRPVAVPFFEWFFRCAGIVNKYMQRQWNDGLIDGFCSKEEAERRLATVADRPTMLIRFSDMLVGFIKISCRLAGGHVVHYETEADKMPVGTSIANAIRHNPTFAAIRNIYPSHTIATLWRPEQRAAAARADDQMMMRGWPAAAAVPPGYFEHTYTLESKPVAALHHHI